MFENYSHYLDVLLVILQVQLKRYKKSRSEKLNQEIVALKQSIVDFTNWNEKNRREFMTKQFEQVLQFPYCEKCFEKCDILENLKKINNTISNKGEIAKKNCKCVECDTATYCCEKHLHEDYAYHHSSFCNLMKQVKYYLGEFSRSKLENGQMLNSEQMEIEYSRDRVERLMYNHNESNNVRQPLVWDLAKWSLTNTKSDNSSSEKKDTIQDDSEWVNIEAQLNQFKNYLKKMLDTQSDLKLMNSKYENNSQNNADKNSNQRLHSTVEFKLFRKIMELESLVNRKDEEMTKIKNENQVLKTRYFEEENKSYTLTKQVEKELENQRILQKRISEMEEEIVLMQKANRTSSVDKGISSITFSQYRVGSLITNSTQTDPVMEQTFAKNIAKRLKGVRDDLTWTKKFAIRNIDQYYKLNENLMNYLAQFYYHTADEQNLIKFSDFELDPNLKLIRSQGVQTDLEDKKVPIEKVKQMVDKQMQTTEYVFETTVPVKTTNSLPEAQSSGSSSITNNNSVKQQPLVQSLPKPSSSSSVKAQPSPKIIRGKSNSNVAKNTQQPSQESQQPSQVQKSSSKFTIVTYNYTD